MFFGEVASKDSKDCFLAHSLTVQEKSNGKQRIRKGQLITPELVELLIANGIEHITVARLEPGDVHEDEAAHQLASSLVGAGLNLSNARTGRVNVHAAETGLLTINRTLVMASNTISQAITFATLAENLWVTKGKMVATAKIIPFGVPGKQLLAAIKAGTAANGQEPALQLYAPQSHHAHLIQTELPATAEKLIKKTEQVTRDRLAVRSSSLQTSTTCEHSKDALVAELERLTTSPACGKDDWLLIVGASAISDENDIIPAAVRQLGGSVQRVGIPVDPGNLLMAAQLRGHVVIGLPGCARSSKANGFDQFLDRMSCGLPLTDSWINSLAVGGLLNEIPERPQPRTSLPALSSSTGNTRDTENNTREIHERKIAAVVLAAGKSQRFGTDNKLLAVWQDKPVLCHTLGKLAESIVDEIILVTGYEHEDIVKALPSLQETEGDDNNPRTGFLENKPLTVIHNPLYSEGLASSLRKAVSFLATRDQQPTRSSRSSSHEDNNQVAADRDTAAAMICLADMPTITTSTYNQLITAWRQDIEAPMDSGQLMDSRLPMAVSTMADTANENTQATVSAYVPVFEKQKGNPVVLTSTLFDNLLSLHGDHGARKLLQSSPGIVREVNVEDAAILMDVDTKAQLDSLE